ncbi:MAG: SGNH/GDSL hydrolase family protein [Acidobacteria bacterium]|nr:SGNH/GDSL hydrolase family protein [Acidobacteriota bacterium]
MTRAWILMACAAVVAAAAPRAEIRLAGDWAVSVKAGDIQAVVPVPRPEIVTVTEERYATLMEFDAKAAPWRRGTRLAGVIAEECTMQGSLDPASLVVRGFAGRALRKGVDYEADLDAGTVGRLPGGAIKADQPVWMSYKYVRQRIDSIVVTADGKVALQMGASHAVLPEPPAVNGERLANVFLSGRLSALTEDNLFPILEGAYPERTRSAATDAEARLPNALRKLRSGERLKILAWGDSVTTFQRWQVMFVNRLKARFPQANIELITEAWGGRNTGSYLKEPPGSVHNYQEKVLAPQPDLIISEFVNDAGLNEQQVEQRYSQLLADFQKIGAEWIVLTPHYVRPDWMKLTRQRDIDDDPRPYVKGLRLFAEKNPVALADASLRYGRLWRQGIPYLTLMENNINHPNMLGHALFADALMALFP